MDFTRLTLQQRISAIAMAVVAVAAFLPWVSIFGISVSGINGDGTITLILALAGIALLAITTGLVPQAKDVAEKIPAKVADIALVAMGGVVALIGLLDMNGAAAIGLYLTLLGGIAWVVGAAWQLTLNRQEATGTPPAAG